MTSGKTTKGNMPPEFVASIRAKHDQVVESIKAFVRKHSPGDLAARMQRLNEMSDSDDATEALLGWLSAFGLLTAILAEADSETGDEAT